MKKINAPIMVYINFYSNFWIDWMPAPSSEQWVEVGAWAGVAKCIYIGWWLVGWVLGGGGLPAGMLHIPLSVKAAAACNKLAISGNIQTGGSCLILLGTSSPHLSPLPILLSVTLHCGPSSRLHHEFFGFGTINACCSWGESPSNTQKMFRRYIWVMYIFKIHS